MNRILLLVQHTACKSSDSSFLGQIFDRHVTFPEDKSLWRLLKSSRTGQTESQQICQTDCRIKKGKMYSKHPMKIIIHSSCVGKLINSHPKSKSILVHYLELLFLTVFALPNASRTGLDCVR